MSRCFGTRTTSSKEYINKKANNTLFCDMRDKFIASGYVASGNNVACVDDIGRFTRYKNNSTMINLAKAHGNYRTDLRKDYYSQKFKDLLCPFALPLNNKTGKYSNGYAFHPPLLTTAEPGDTAQTREVQSWTRIGDADPGTGYGDEFDEVESVNNRFAEVAKHLQLDSGGVLVTDSLDGKTQRFISGKKKDYTKWISRPGSRCAITLASEIPPPELFSITIIFV